MARVFRQPYTKPGRGGRRVTRWAKNWYIARKTNAGGSGLRTCKAVEQATALYKSDNDTFSNFIEECLAAAPGVEEDRPYL